jgi:hypothetical protein
LFVEGGVEGASVSMAVTLYLALTGITEVDRAIAYGSMSLLLVYLKCWYMGGMAKNMGANTLAVGIATFCVGAGAGYMLQSGNALAVAKIISSVVVVWSLLHYLFPGLLKLTFGIDMKNKVGVVCFCVSTIERSLSLFLCFLTYRYLLGAKSKVLLKAACVYLMANVVLNGCLARGVDSVQAVGYLALTLLLGSLDIIIRGKAAIPTLEFLSGLVPFFVWLTMGTNSHGCWCVWHSHCV